MNVGELQALLDGFPDQAVVNFLDPDSTEVYEPTGDVGREETDGTLRAWVNIALVDLP